MLAAPMLAAWVVAAGCAAWHPAAVGFYPGVGWSDGEKPVDTWIEEAADGRLQGRYILHEPGRDVEGRLEPLGDESCNVAVFRWTDLYGSGLTRLVFDPTRHCFDGAWGRLTINPALYLRACVRERVTS